MIAVPNSSYRDTTDIAVRIIGTSGFGLIGVAILANLFSFVTGAIAWFNGAGRCQWIIVSGIVMLIPIVLLVLSWLNV